MCDTSGNVNHYIPMLYANGGYPISYRAKHSVYKKIDNFNLDYIVRKINSQYTKELWDSCARLFFRSELTRFTVLVIIEHFNPWNKVIIIRVRFEAYEDKERLYPFRDEEQTKTKLLEFPYKPPYPWIVRRLLWIAKLKNSPFDCELSKLPHELIKYIDSML
jgi:hypothetical protein